MAVLCTGLVRDQLPGIYTGNEGLIIIRSAGVERKRIINGGAVFPERRDVLSGGSVVFQLDRRRSLFARETSARRIIVITRYTRVT